MHQLLQHLQWLEARRRTRPRLVQFVLFAGSTPHNKRTRPGRIIRYLSDGSVFDPRRLFTRTKTVEMFIIEALLADDCALKAHKTHHLQTIVDRLAEASRLFGLTISHGKTEVLVQAALNTILPLPNITTGRVQLKCVESFKYPDSTISSGGSLRSENTSRIHKASQARGRLKSSSRKASDCGQSSRSTELWLSPRFSMDVKHGLRTAGTSNS